jgi:hypothetical protein
LDECDVNKIKADSDCTTTNGCQDNPGLISTRCPVACGICGPAFACSAAEHDTVVAEYGNLLQACPKSCSHKPLEFPDATFGIRACPVEDDDTWKPSSCGTDHCASYKGSAAFRSEFIPLLNKCYLGAGDGLQSVLHLQCVSESSTIQCSAMEEAEMLAEKYVFFEACPKSCTHDVNDLRLGIPACPNVYDSEWAMATCTTACAQYIGSRDYSERVIPLVNKCHPTIGDMIEEQLRTTCSTTVASLACEDPDYPLANLGLPASDHLQWSCAEFKNFYGLGLSDDCNADIITAHPNCDDSCKREPGFINTRCPKSCGLCQPTPPTATTTTIITATVAPTTATMSTMRPTPPATRSCDVASAKVAPSIFFVAPTNILSIVILIPAMCGYFVYDWQCKWEAFVWHAALRCPSQLEHVSIICPPLPCGCGCGQTHVLSHALAPAHLATASRH